eukprot:Gb_40148 [translate_table: standard]
MTAAALDKIFAFSKCMEPRKHTGDIGTEEECTARFGGDAQKLDRVSLWYHAFPLQNRIKPITKRPLRKQEEYPLLGSQKSKVDTMEKEQDKGQNFRHFCKICKRRFACGRALGGHMRIHGAGAMAAAAQLNSRHALDEGYRKTSCRVLESGSRTTNRSSGSVQGEEQQESQQFDAAPNNPMYDLRRNRKQNWRFTDGDYSLPIPSKEECYPNNDLESDSNEQRLESQSNTDIIDTACGDTPNSNARMKGKRSHRHKPSVDDHLRPCSEEAASVSPQNEEEEMANCLVMLSNAGGFWGPAREVGLQGVEQSSTSRSMDIQLPIADEYAPEFAKLSKKRSKLNDDDLSDKLKSQHVSKKSTYECKTCNKIFHSFQALGGHRASHKNVKGCSAKIDMQEEHENLEEEIITTDEDLSRAEYQQSTDFHKPPPPKDQVREFCTKEESDETLGSSRKAKIHECSICHRVFASGQALGGHKRCHWITTGTSETTTTISSSKQHPIQQPQQRPVRGDLLDLNLPAPVDEGVHVHMEDGNPPKNLVKNVNNSHVEADCEAFPCYIQPWWIGSNQAHGLFSYHGHTYLAPDDEVDSKPKCFG